MLRLGHECPATALARPGAWLLARWVVRLLGGSFRDYDAWMRARSFGLLGSGTGARVGVRAASVTVLCVLLGASAASAAVGRPVLAKARSGAVPVRVDMTGPSQRIPPSFLGISVEADELLSYARGGPVVDRALSLLRPASGDPVLLRVGGRSADDTYWNLAPLNAPRGVFELDDNWVEQLAALARRDRLRVTLAVNVAVHSPAMAAGLAHAVFQALAPGGLVGLAIGNEPDLFGHQPGLQAERVPSTIPSTPLEWTRGYSPSRYRSDYLDYARALAGAVPGVPLAGPETASLTLEWIHVLSGLGPLSPGSLTVHRYPFSSCWASDSPMYPRLSSLLSERASAGLAGGLRGAIAFARRARMSLRVSELNSVSCGGRPGVSDSFATALWAPDVLFELIRAGVDGVNWHIRPQMINAPFELAAGAIDPLPELYGLALFAQLMGVDARRVGVRVSSPGGVHLKVWAVRSRRRTTVLLINKGSRAASVTLPVARVGSRVQLERLSAPSISSRYGVRLAGRVIGSDGRWHGRSIILPLRSSDRRYRFLVPGYSAALVQATRT